MEDWVTVAEIYPTEHKARKIAGIIEITESRLAGVPGGPQYAVETEVIKVPAGWQIKWRKVLTGYDTGCSGCGSCHSEPCGSDEPAKSNKVLAKVIPFKPREK